MQNKKLVSVYTLTYNHSQFIRECLDSILDQKTTFDFEAVIGEDCSTDGTREIVIDYAKAHPGKINLITSEQNVGMRSNAYRTLNACKGKYIAWCDGDDYWTDPYKLQKQVDFLEANPNYSFCCHRNKVYDQTSHLWESDHNEEIFKKSDTGIEIDPNIIFRKWLTTPLTVVFKREALDLGLFKVYEWFTDTHLLTHLILNGNGYCLNFFGGVYRRNLGGVVGKLPYFEKCQLSLNLFKEIYCYTKAHFVKRLYIETLSNYIEMVLLNKKLKVQKKQILNHIYELFCLSKYNTTVLAVRLVLIPILRPNKYK